MLPIEKVTFEPTHTGVPEILRAAVDLTVLASYEEIQLTGEPDLIVELIDLYREDAPRRVAFMRESLAQRNWISLKREAHSLRGSSGHLGASQIVLICGEIEGVESGNLFPSIEALLSILEQELEHVLRMLLAERKRRLS